MIDSAHTDLVVTMAIRRYVYMIPEVKTLSFVDGLTSEEEKRDMTIGLAIGLSVAGLLIVVVVAYVSYIGYKKYKWNQYLKQKQMNQVGIYQFPCSVLLLYDQYSFKKNIT